MKLKEFIETMKLGGTLDDKNIIIKMLNDNIIYQGKFGSIPKELLKNDLNVYNNPYKENAVRRGGKYIIPNLEDPESSITIIVCKQIYCNDKSYKEEGKGYNERRDEFLNSISNKVNIIEKAKKLKSRKKLEYTISFKGDKSYSTKEIMDWCVEQILFRGECEEIARYIFGNMLDEVDFENPENDPNYYFISTNIEDNQHFFQPSNVYFQPPYQFPIQYPSPTNNNNNNNNKYGNMSPFIDNCSPFIPPEIMSSQNYPNHCYSCKDPVIFILDTSKSPSIKTDGKRYTKCTKCNNGYIEEYIYDEVDQTFRFIGNNVCPECGGRKMVEISYKNKNE